MAVNTKVSIPTASTLVISDSIKGCVLSNNGTAGTIWIQMGQSMSSGVQPPAVVGEGIPLAPGASLSLLELKLSQAPVYAISSAGTNSLAVWYI